MSSFGIMTLTRAPCELDKMSLFQDLKLKRRKVDSRCSSDGESVADTSTSSPDLVCPSSPKMSEAVLNPPSPDSTPIHHPPEPTLDKISSRLEDSGVFDGGGTASVIRSLSAIRSQSPPLRPATTPSPCQPPRPHSSPGRPANTSPVIIHNPAMTAQPPSSPSKSTIVSQEPTSSSPSEVAPKRGVIIAHPASMQTQLWLKHSRINGVKPELIGGNFGAALGAYSELKSPTGAGPLRPGAPVRQTPTVIMGEAGGVRTMIWSQPTLTPSPTSPVDPQHHPTTSWGSGSNVSNTEESAAQMLLNLGQDRLRSPATRTLVSPQSPSTSHFGAAPLNMERLWAGDLRQLPVNQTPLNLSTPTAAAPVYPDVKPPVTEAGESQEGGEEEEQPMICMICEDKATGLHYGIITCEGCKGFFKRTVQNRRVYTCVADGNCEITKAQRNRCQYCRFKKCIEQGMVLQAVREDRMPGGRNSGAVYNLYKVKYKKHKKPACKQPQKAAEKNVLSQQFKVEQPSSIPANLVNGTILKTALTNPSEVVRFRQRLDSAVSSSKDRNFSLEYSISMIKTLMDCDDFQELTTLQNLEDLLDQSSDLSAKLCHIGDSIVYKLVQWTKRLPFYLELPIEIHTRQLTNKWHELLVLTTAAYQAIHVPEGSKRDFMEQVEFNLFTIQNYLTTMMGKEVMIEQLRHDIGEMVGKLTLVTLLFRELKLTMEEYVCLKVMIMLSKIEPTPTNPEPNSPEVELIHERYKTCLRVYLQHMYPPNLKRFHEILNTVPEIKNGADLLLLSKMFYVPFILIHASEPR